MMRPTSLRHAGAGAAVLALSLLLGTAAAPQKTSPADARSSQGSGAFPADTLLGSVPAGEPLVLLLPETDGASYAVARAPAFSWLVQRSFMWNTMPEDAGRHEILLERSAGGTLDTLVLIITVE